MRVLSTEDLVYYVTLHVAIVLQTLEWLHHARPDWESINSTVLIFGAESIQQT